MKNKLCTQSTTTPHFSLLQPLETIILFSVLGILLLLLLLCHFSCVRLCVTRRQPTRLPRPWDSPGKNTGVGCHFLLQCMKVKSEREVAQSCPTLATPWTAACPAPPSMGFSRIAPSGFCSKIFKLLYKSQRKGRGKTCLSREKDGLRTEKNRKLKR